MSAPKMSRTAQAENQRQLEELGFSVKDRRVYCDSCQAVAIQGYPTHEFGCPNQKHECTECCTLIGRGYRLCESCANPEAFED